MARFPILAEQVYLSAAAPVATDAVVGGLRRDATNIMTRAAASGGTQFVGGLLMTNLGQVVYNDASAGLPANTQWINGLPLAPDGSLCVALSPGIGYSNGIPFAANGAVSATIV